MSHSSSPDAFLMIFMCCEFGDSLPSGNTNFESVSGPNCQHFEGKEQIESGAGRAMTPPHSFCAPCTTLVTKARL